MTTLFYFNGHGRKLWRTEARRQLNVLVAASSQAAIAKQLHVSKQRVSDWCAGVRPTLDEIRHIEDVLRIAMRAWTEPPCGSPLPADAARVTSETRPTPHDGAEHEVKRTAVA